MSVLKAKSENSLRSAQLLIDQNQFACSVHGAYYGCVQLMKYILKTTHQLNEAAIEAEQRTYSLTARQQGRDAGVHAYLINRFLKELRDNNLFGRYRQTIGQLPQLKKLRTDADYTEVVTSKAEATNALALAARICDDLKYLNRIPRMPLIL
jgi:uncharacterized protein (UPF0332 family)